MSTASTTVWQRNLAVLAVGQMVAISAMGIVIPLIPFFLRELGMTDQATLERWSGLIFSGPFLAAAVMSPVWGYVGDRFGHKKMVLRAIMGLAAVNFLLVFVQTPAQFLIIRITQGLVTGFIPAALAITADSTPRERLPESMGKLAASVSAGRLLGPALGGVLAGFLAFRQLFLLTGSMIAVCAIFVGVYLKEPPRDATRQPVSLMGPFLHSLRESRLRLALPGLLVAMVAIGMTMPIFPLYVEGLCEGVADPKVITGVGFAMVAAFTLIASAFLGKISGRVGLKTLLVGALVLAAVALALHPLATGIPSMLAIRALLGISTAGIGPVLHSMIGRAAPEGMRGGVTGLANSATILGFFVGPVGGGWLANHVGIHGVFRVAALVALVCAVVAAIVTKSVGRDRQIVRLPRETPR